MSYLDEMARDEMDIMVEEARDYGRNLHNIVQKYKEKHTSEAKIIHGNTLEEEKAEKEREKKMDAYWKQVPPDVWKLYSHPKKNVLYKCSVEDTERLIEENNRYWE